jgi:twitching motility protein PilT
VWNSLSRLSALGDEQAESGHYWPPTSIIARMANAAQQIFKKIVLHNKLMDEATIDRLLAEIPAPEKVIKHLVGLKKLPLKKGEQLLGLFRKQLEKHGEIEMEVSADAQPAAEQKKSAPAKSKPTQPEPASSSSATGDIPTSPVIAKLMLTARSMNASDLHIKAGEVPLVRVAGSLRNMPEEPPLDAEACERELLKLLLPKQREVFLETNDFDFCYDGGPELGRYRANLMRQFRGMDGIFRLIDAKPRSFEELSLPEVVYKFTEYKQGIVLVTGPKGCGKTTTLAAMVDLINKSRREHIITVEDPIEYVHPCKMGHVNQREVGPHTNSFSAALRAALREAPDVIMVGEMRDLETTSLAITAAETGHLVFGTLHTPDAIRTIDRVLDVFPPKEQGQIRSMISESMRGIVSQLLVPSKDGKSEHLAVEVLVNTMAIGNLIRGEKTYQLRGMIQTGRKLGMCLMDDSLIRLAQEGKIDKQEAIVRAVERKRVEEELAKL